jgi:hypothetical protein
MSQFNAVNALAVCSISTIVKRLESTRSISCTRRARDTCTGTKEETPDTDKGLPSGLPRQSSTLLAWSTSLPSESEFVPFLP